MKIRQILYKVIFITMLIIICNSCMCYANPVEPLQPILLGEAGGNGGGASGETSGFEINTDLFQPGLNGVGKASEITSILLGVFTVLGAIITVISIAIIGFNTILGSANEKAEYQQKLVGVIIGAIVLMCGSIIARVLISFAEAL